MFVLGVTLLASLCAFGVMVKRYYEVLEDYKQAVETADRERERLNNAWAEDRQRATTYWLQVRGLESRIEDERRIDDRAEETLHAQIRLLEDENTRLRAEIRELREGE